jgi:hypothetical protein
LIRPVDVREAYIKRTEFEFGVELFSDVEVNYSNILSALIPVIHEALTDILHIAVAFVHLVTFLLAPGVVVFGLYSP